MSFQRPCVYAQGRFWPWFCCINPAAQVTACHRLLFKYLPICNWSQWKVLVSNGELNLALHFEEWNNGLTSKRMLFCSSWCYLPQEWQLCRWITAAEKSLRKQDEDSMCVDLATQNNVVQNFSKRPWGDCSFGKAFAVVKWKPDHQHLQKKPGIVAQASHPSVQMMETNGSLRLAGLPASSRLIEHQKLQRMEASWRKWQGDPRLQDKKDEVKEAIRKEALLSMGRTIPGS